MIDFVWIISGGAFAGSTDQDFFVVYHNAPHRKLTGDQGRNVADCLHKLREMLLSVAVAPKKRKSTKPSRASRERRLRDKRQQSEKKKSRRRDWRRD